MARTLSVIILSFILISACVFSEESVKEDAFVANVEGFLSVMHTKLEACGSVIEELRTGDKIPTATYETIEEVYEALRGKHAEIGYRLEEYRSGPLPYRHDWILEDMEWFSEGIFMLGFELEYWANHKVEA